MLPKQEDQRPEDIVLRAVAMKSQIGFLVKLNKLVLKFIWKDQRGRNRQDSSEEVKEVEMFSFQKVRLILKL